MFFNTEKDQNLVLRHHRRDGGSLDVAFFPSKESSEHSDLLLSYLCLGIQMQFLIFVL